MNNMTAVMTNTNIDRESLLGYMAFYHMPGVTLGHTELENIFIDNQMSTDYLPQKIYGHDAFRRVTGKIRGNIDVNIYGMQRTAKLNIDEVRNDNNEIIRVVGRKLIDAANSSVKYEAVGTFTYNKNTEQISHTAGTYYSSEFDYENNVMLPVVRDFADAVAYHSRDTIRTIINRVFQAQNPVTIIKGAYFIPKSHEDELLALSNIITDLTAYADDATDPPEMRIIPLLDTVEQRDLIQKKANKELTKELDEITYELTQVLLDNKELKSVTLLRLNNTFQTLRDKTNEYSSLLNVKLSDTENLFAKALTLFTNARAIPA